VGVYTGAGRAIREGAGACTAYGRISIHHNQIGPNVDSDGIGIDGGCDVFNNVIDGIGCNNVTHADGIQGVGSYWRIYNNIFHDHGQEIFIETTATPFGHIHIYNNVIYTPSGATLTAPGINLWAKQPTGAHSWSDIVIANNVFHLLQMSALRCGASTGVTVTITASLLANNSFVECSGGNTLFNDYSDGGTVQWSSGGFLWQTNIFNTPETTRWQSTDYATVAALQAAQVDATGNLNSAPTFTNASTHDYTPTGAGNAQVDHGISLATYFTTDKLGISRPQGSAWDIGAYEYISHVYKRLSHHLKLKGLALI
jgi:hypothetical protein